MTIRERVASITDIRGRLAELERLTQQGPLLTPEQREQWEKFDRAVCRARSTLRRARAKAVLVPKATADAVEVAAVEKAQKALDRARDRKRAFVEPLCAHLWAPKKVRAVFESRWGGGPYRDGGYKAHVQTCDMVLDEVDISGPQYRTVAVVSDVGGPPTGARKPPDLMGIAWFAVGDMIKSGRMVVLPDEEG